MDTHYVCTGSCAMVSDAPKVCDSDTCNLKGQEMTECHCSDGNHDEAHRRVGTGLGV